MSETSESHDKKAAADASFSVQRVASLARLDPGDTGHIEAQMRRILQFVAILDQLNLEHVEPFYGATDLQENAKDQSMQQPIRQDEPVESLPREQVLKNSPSGDDEFYLVPPVFD